MKELNHENIKTKPMPDGHKVQFVPDTTRAEDIVCAFCLFLALPLITIVTIVALVVSCFKI